MLFAIYYFDRFVRTGISSTKPFLVISKSLFEIIGDAGIEATVKTEKNINEEGGL